MEPRNPVFVEPTSSTERKATSFVAFWRVADDPPGSESGACLRWVPQEPGRSRALPSKQRRGRRYRNGPGRSPLPRAIGAKRGDDGYGEVKATKPSWTEHEKSESAGSTDESGELDPRDPPEGSGRPDLDDFWRER